MLSVQEQNEIEIDEAAKKAASDSAECERASLDAHHHAARLTYLFRSELIVTRLTMSCTIKDDNGEQVETIALVGCDLGDYANRRELAISRATDFGKSCVAAMASRTEESIAQSKKFWKSLAV